MLQAKQLTCIFLVIAIIVLSLIAYKLYVKKQTDKEGYDCPYCRRRMMMRQHCPCNCPMCHSGNCPMMM
jgi:hypothetical protein